MARLQGCASPCAEAEFSGISIIGILPCPCGSVPSGKGSGPRRVTPPRLLQTRVQAGPTLPALAICNQLCAHTLFLHM